MSRPRIVEQNYFEFLSALRTAGDQRERIEPRDKERWKAFVTENRIQEAAFSNLAGKKFDELTAVIIDTDGPWKGYYLYTSVEEACLKWVRE